MKEINIIHGKDGHFLSVELYRTNLNSPTILLIHGIGSNSEEFGYLPQNLVKLGFNVMGLNLSGHGMSSGPRGLITRESLLSDLRLSTSFIKEFGCSDIFALGHSFGAHGALLALSEELVTSAILVAPQRKSGDSLTGIKKLAFRLVGNLYKLFPYFPTLYLDNNPRIKDIATTEEERRLLTSVRFFEPKINLKTLSLMIQANNEELVLKTSKPLLLLACEKDREIPVERIEKLAQVSKNQKNFSRIKNAGHSPFFGPAALDIAVKTKEFAENL
jgi:pimeloyl-ACP methyl ester carboxylesterase